MGERSLFNEPFEWIIVATAISIVYTQTVDFECSNGRGTIASFVFDFFLKKYSQKLKTIVSCTISTDFLETLNDITLRTRMHFIKLQVFLWRNTANYSEVIRLHLNKTCSSNSAKARTRRRCIPPGTWLFIAFIADPLRLITATTTREVAYYPQLKNALWHSRDNYFWVRQAHINVENKWPDDKTIPLMHILFYGEMCA